MKISKQIYKFSNGSITTKNETKRKGGKTKTKNQKARSASHSMPFRIANTSHLYPIKCMTSTLPYSLRLPYRRSHRRFGSPSVGSTNNAERRLIKNRNHQVSSTNWLGYPLRAQIVRFHPIKKGTDIIRIYLFSHGHEMQQQTGNQPL